MITALRNYIEGIQKAAVAYSGGVDSTFLLTLIARTLGEGNVVALTIQSPLTPLWEVNFAKEYCQASGIRQMVLDGSFILEDERFTSNPPLRCYLCKKQLLEAMMKNVPDAYPLLTGTNATDEPDSRPGMKAEEEMGVKTPLRKFGFTRSIIKEQSQLYQIPGFERPPSACFATRIPYGELITVTKVKMIEQAETLMKEFGFALVRVRLIPGDIACIEVANDTIRKVIALRDDISRQFGSIGFRRVTIDLEGYRG